MKSLAEFRDELLGVRLQATNNSLWQMAAALTETARVAYNEAVQTYRFAVRRVYNSLEVEAGCQNRLVVPWDIERPLEVYAVSSTYGTRRRITSFRLVPTTETMFLDVDARMYQGVTNVELEYESRVTAIPPECYLAGALTTLGTVLQVTGLVPAVQCRAPGYLQIRSVSDTGPREVVRYHSVGDSAFHALVRNVGPRTMPYAWSLGDIVSPMIEVPDDAAPTLQHAATAALYHFWLRNRAQYDKYTAIAGLQRLGLDDLITLIDSEEARAARRAKSAHRLPPVGQVQHRGRRK